MSEGDHKREKRRVWEQQGEVDLGRGCVARAAWLVPSVLVREIEMRMFLG